MALGPVDVLVVKFPGNKFKGEIAPALNDLVDSGTIRVLDLLFATKDADGNVEAIEADSLNIEDFPDLGRFVVDPIRIFSEEDVATFGTALEPNSSAALLLFENTWAGRFTEALINANAELVMFERIPRAVIEDLTTA
jgi:Family of unknown function (DUF6325)